MAIIARAAGVVLLLVALALLSGNARAAEPSYDDYVAQVNAGKLDIDYTAFRTAYVASPKYEPYGAARLLVIQMKKAFTAGDCPAAMAHAKEIFEVNLVQIDAHYVTAVCQRKAGNEEEARREHAMLMGLVKSVLGSGDGTSPETAFVVIAIEEEYSVLAAFAGQPGVGEFGRIRLRPDGGQEAGFRPNRNALFQCRPPDAEQVATEEDVDEYAAAAVHFKRSAGLSLGGRLPDPPQMGEAESALIF